MTVSTTLLTISFLANLVAFGYALNAIRYANKAVDHAEDALRILRGERDGSA